MVFGGARGLWGALTKRVTRRPGAPRPTSAAPPDYGAYDQPGHSTTVLRIKPRRRTKGDYQNKALHPDETKETH